MPNVNYLSFLISVLLVLSGCSGSGVIVTDDDDTGDDDDIGDDDDTGDDDVSDDDDDDITGEFAAEVDIQDIHIEPGPDPAQPPHLVASLRFAFINTYEEAVIDTVTPRPVRILRAADDTEVVSILVEPIDHWDQVVPADSAVTIDYEMTGLSGPPPGPQDLPCNDEVYAEAEVNYGSGEAVSAVSAPVTFSCDAHGPEEGFPS